MESLDSTNVTAESELLANLSAIVTNPEDSFANHADNSSIIADTGGSSDDFENKVCTKFPHKVYCVHDGTAASFSSADWWFQEHVTGGYFASELDENGHQPVVVLLQDGYEASLLEAFKHPLRRVKVRAGARHGLRSGVASKQELPVKYK
jgi:hypothetical protein